MQGLWKMQCTKMHKNAQDLGPQMKGTGPSQQCLEMPFDVAICKCTSLSYGVYCLGGYSGTHCPPLPKAGRPEKAHPPPQLNFPGA